MIEHDWTKLENGLSQEHAETTIQHIFGKISSHML
jgi:hypothetical protein